MNTPELAALLRWAAGVNGDGPKPDALLDISRDELDRVVKRARLRAYTGQVRPAQRCRQPEPEVADWLVDVLQEEPCTQR